MFYVKNHKQLNLFDPWACLGPKRRRELDKSWAGLFRNNILQTLPVDELRKHYHANNGRPTKELYAMLGLMILQQMHDLTDEQTVEQFAFNIKWHYALDITSSSDVHSYVFKGQNLLGTYVYGSTGKSFAYGATDGLFMIQNMADSRACIRLSGADVVFGARITSPVCDELGNIASRAHLKGFAFEYMTGGSVLVLGDPGPWICAGMTGGVIYQCIYPEFGFDKQAIERRMAKSANVKIQALTKSGLADVQELLEKYINELEKGFQAEEAQAVSTILRDGKKRFLAIQSKPLRPPSAE